ncbi:MAG: endonuclease [Crocinitomicaceae bacterium]
MKNRLTLFFLWFSFFLTAQVPPYYSSIDFSQSGSSVKTQLTSLISSTHNQITYDDCWNVLKISDLETGSSTHVLLVYGYNDTDGDPVTDRTRNKDLNGGNVGEWNREHVFPKSLANPDLGTSGPGADAHNLRASDTQQNNNRGNKKFISGTGNPGDISGDWYPGDEFRGDCARIIMYMYLRYESQCLPSAVGTGTINSIDPNMVDLFLDWNADDAVSQFEKDRNDAIQNAQGNRNPFIDNPAIATKIWGGPLAEETWEVVSISSVSKVAIVVYPVPVTEDMLYISGLSTLDLQQLQLTSISGQLIDQLNPEEIVKNGGISMDQYKSGSYILSLIFEDQIVRKKIIIQ